MLHHKMDTSETPETVAELRQNTRVGFSMATQVFEPDGAVRDTVSMNLSEDGLFVATESPPALGEQRRVEITPPSGADLLSGVVEVCWRQDEPSGDLPAGFGARWRELELQDSEAIQAAVRSALSRDVILEDLKRRTTPNLLKGKIERIQGQRLSQEIQDFVDAYGRYGERHPFIWKWVCKGLDLTALSCIDPAYRDEVQAIKLLSVMYDVLLDDAADRIRDRNLVDQLLLISYEQAFLDRDRIPSQYHAYFDFAVQVWDEIARRTRSLPRYSEFSDLLEFDYRQLLNCMRYAMIINSDPLRLNVAEHDLYQPHNMHMMINALIDIMASPNFDKTEMGLLREAAWNAQVMGRIGNGISTWQREIKDRDFTSGVFAEAVSGGLLNPEDLLSDDLEMIETKMVQSGIEEQLLVQWGGRRDNLKRLSGRIHSVDLGVLTEGLEELISLHLGSRGLK